MSTSPKSYVTIAFRRSGAVVKVRATDYVVGGGEFESRHCHLTGHLPGPLMPPQIM